MKMSTAISSLRTTPKFFFLLFVGVTNIHTIEARRWKPIFGFPGVPTSPQDVPQDIPRKDMGERLLEQEKIFDTQQASSTTKTKKRESIFVDQSDDVERDELKRYQDTHRRPEVPIQPPPSDLDIIYRSILYSRALNPSMNWIRSISYSASPQSPTLCT